jgi:hypothetical protein
LASICSESFFSLMERTVFLFRSAAPTVLPRLAAGLGSAMGCK